MTTAPPTTTPPAPQDDAERLALAIRDCLDDFEAPVHLYIEGESARRWEESNPDGDWYDQPESRDDLIDYKIIANAVREASITAAHAEIATLKEEVAVAKAIVPCMRCFGMGGCDHTWGERLSFINDRLRSAALSGDLRAENVDALITAISKGSRGYKLSRRDNAIGPILMFSGGGYDTAWEMYLQLDPILKALASPRPDAGAPGEATCMDCHGNNPVWFAPNNVWNSVMGGPEAKDDPGGFVCPGCFIKRAEASNIIPTAWKLYPENLEAPSPSPEAAPPFVQPKRGRMSASDAREWSAKNNPLTPQLTDTERAELEEFIYGEAPTFITPRKLLSILEGWRDGHEEEKLRDIQCAFDDVARAARQAGVREGREQMREEAAQEAETHTRIHTASLTIAEAIRALAPDQKEKRE